MFLEQRVVAARETGETGERALAGGVREVGFDGGVGVVTPGAKDVGRAENRAEIVRRLDLGVGHPSVG